MLGISSVAAQLAASQEGLSSMSEVSEVTSIVLFLISYISNNLIILSLFLILLLLYF
jgi:hypothetical protein